MGTVVFAPHLLVFLSAHVQKNILYLKKVTVLVKRQILPDGEEDNSNSPLRNYYRSLAILEEEDLCHYYCMTVRAVTIIDNRDYPIVIYYRDNDSQVTLSR